MSKFKLTLKAGSTTEYGGLTGAALAIFCANVIKAHQGPVIIITDDMQQTARLYEEINQHCQIDDANFKNTLFPDWETLPYDNFSPHQEIISQRLACLNRLSTLKKGALILPINTLMQKICPKSFLDGHVFIMNKGQVTSRDSVVLQLENAGYRNVTQVMEHGEYATRGAILDIFPMGSEFPYRIDFFDDEIDSIRLFNVENQRTQNEIEQIKLLPAHEFPFDKKSIELFRAQWRDVFPVRLEPESIYQQVRKNIVPTGIEYWQKLFFNEPLIDLFAYLANNALIINTANIYQNAEKHWHDINQRYENRKVDPMRPLLKPNDIWLKVEDVFALFKNYPRLIVHANQLESKHAINLNYENLPALAIQIKQKEPYKDFDFFTQSFKGKIIFAVESEGRKEALQDILSRIKIMPQFITQLDEINTNKSDRFFLIISASEQGFINLDENYAFITENELLGRQTIRRRSETKNAISTDNIIRSLAELTPGKPVVHLEHGVGRYLGLTTIETNGITAEYLVLVYANETKLYVPISSLDLISRYSGGNEENAPLNKLGNDSWSKSRDKAAEKIRDVAAELLDIYSQRQAKTGFEFKQDREQYELFCQGFPYQETIDQQSAIGAVIGDMCSPIAMDRLVCGDVGFGKTEVAMRAAFLSVINHKQVALLVPTTLLAQQHYENFLDRFANWPIKIEVLSRFKSAKEQKQIITELENGKIDIIVGTHKLLQTDVKWHDLGLLVIDEEHRFGVRQKERIKAMRANVDILTLTATPIPRTLNMAMSGIRDLSIIATAPARRLAIKTFVREHDEYIIKEAILREILRGGQAYYLHNDVAHILKTKEFLENLVPEARIIVGHGQMHERDLEKVMNDFHHQRYNVLLCTTIIETGIDIPNANTIIIDRADKFGLAQLHQLRGRVGRSHHQAYAYLLTPPPKLITKDALKRLEAIATLEDLGAGFALATHDLEIRGAGELLGEDQSGQIESIGFTLYMDLLDEAVNALKSGKPDSLDSMLHKKQTEVELKLPALIPDDYIIDVNTRLSLYKRIASIADPDDLIDIKIEMIDRFGKLPDQVLFLLAITQIRFEAKQLGITKIELNEKGGYIEFGANNAISIDYLIEKIQKNPQKFRLDGQNRLKLLINDLERNQRIDYIIHLIEEFKLNTAK